MRYVFEEFKTSPHGVLSREGGAILRLVLSYVAPTYYNTCLGHIFSAQYADHKAVCFLVLLPLGRAFLHRLRQFTTPTSDATGDRLRTGSLPATTASHCA